MYTEKVLQSYINNSRYRITRGALMDQHPQLMELIYLKIWKKV